MGKLDPAIHEPDKLEGLESGMQKEYRVKELKADLKNQQETGEMMQLGL